MRQDFLDIQYFRKWTLLEFPTAWKTSEVRFVIYACVQPNIPEIESFDQIKLQRIL